jgi:hypothetical protein
MKVFGLFFKTLLLVTSIILFAGLLTGCKDPDEYQPYQDSLISPPAAPQPLNPQDGAGWVYIPALGPVIVEFEWTPVAGAEYYELHLYADSNFVDTTIYKVSYNTITIAFLPRQVYWHVRASSSHWTWFTDWSEMWYCRIWWPIE